MKKAQEKAAALNESHALAVADGMKRVRFVTEFHRLFPAGTSSISYYTGQAGDPIWHSEVGLHERYVLTMQLKIKLDETRTKVIESDEPQFYLDEVEGISPGFNGPDVVRYGAQKKRFNATDWDKLVQANGDFLAIGVRLKKDKPVAEFSKALRPS